MAPAPIAAIAKLRVKEKQLARKYPDAVSPMPINWRLHRRMYPRHIR